jgi:hypothetical protein
MEYSYSFFRNKIVLVVSKPWFIIDYKEKYNNSILPLELIKERSNSSHDFLLLFAY